MVQKSVLLLNASNMEEFPVYPYAFIQIPAVARRHGIHVACKDLLGIQKSDWGKTVLSLVEAQQPEMILVTLRNTDSLTFDDYKQVEDPSQDGKSYFPIEQTKDLIAAIRSVTDLKIAVGGFAFTLLHRELMHYLEPDYGVVFGPDEFFLRFEDILKGNLEGVSNTLYFRDGEVHTNPVRLFPPLDGPEYTTEAVQQMQAFNEEFPAPGIQGSPVEVNRGCNHQCVFCAEPFGKGQEVRYRSIPAIMADIRTLVEHGIRNIYIISSELNPEGNDFILEVADEIYAFNQSQPEEEKITWFGANYLLKLSYEEHQRMNRSGFTGGWFDITALDDENARAMKTPYRNNQLIGDIKSYIRTERIRQMEQDKDITAPADAKLRWTMFMGNPATTLETIRKTLEIANQEGFSQEFVSCSLFPVTRVFDYEDLDESALEVTVSITPDLEEIAYDQLLPSFAFAPALLEEFGSGDEIKKIFKYLAETFLSTCYQESRNWLDFLQQNTNAVSIAAWVSEITTTHGVEVPQSMRTEQGSNPTARLIELFSTVPERKEDKERWEREANDLVDVLISTGMAIFPDTLQALELPGSNTEADQTTPYSLAVRLLSRWQMKEVFYTQMDEISEGEMSEILQEYFRFSVRAILHRYNIKFSEPLRKVLVG